MTMFFYFKQNETFVFKRTNNTQQAYIYLKGRNEYKDRTRNIIQEVLNSIPNKKNNTRYNFNKF